MVTFGKYLEEEGLGRIPKCLLTRYVTLSLSEFIRKQSEDLQLKRHWSGECVIRSVPEETERGTLRQMSDLFPKFPIQRHLGSGTDRLPALTTERPARKGRPDPEPRGGMRTAAPHLQPHLETEWGFLSLRPPPGLAQQAAWEATPAPAR